MRVFEEINTRPRTPPLKSIKKNFKDKGEPNKAKGNQV